MFGSMLFSSMSQLLIFSAIPFVWWFITARKKENFIIWLGLKKIEKNGNLLSSLFLVVAVIFVYGLVLSRIVGMYEGITGAGSELAGKGLTAIPAAIVYGVIKTALSEEIVFRSFLLKRVADRFGFVAGNTVQALLFGLLHGIPFGLVTNSMAVGIAVTLLPAALGWVMGWFNEKRCGGSIIPGWLFHAAINVCVAIAAL